MDGLWAHLATGHRGARDGLRRPVVMAAAVAVLASAAVLAGVGPAGAAPPIRVNCDAAGTNLQEAINNAPSGATLFVTGMCRGAFSIGKNLSLLGQGIAVLDGSSTFEVAVTVGQVALYASTISGNTGAEDGGGIQTTNGTVTLSNSAVTGNVTGFHGGGIDTDNGSVTVNTSTVTGNLAFDGGGIFNDGLVTLNGSTVADNFPNNCAPSGSVAGCSG